MPPTPQLRIPRVRDLGAWIRGAFESSKAEYAGKVVGHGHNCFYLLTKDCTPLRIQTTPQVVEWVKGVSSDVVVKALISTNWRGRHTLERLQSTKLGIIFD